MIADTGRPPPFDASASAHAGCLSFEMSSQRRLFVVNAGVDNHGPADFLTVARATAAHSTAVINDTSSCGFLTGPRQIELMGRRITSGPEAVESRRIDERGMQGFVASHDGYVPAFGLMHERMLILADDGATLVGRDRFFRPDGGKPRFQKDHVAVRFHIHPGVEVLRDDHDRIALSTAGAEAWIFSCAEAVPVIEESIFFAGLSGPRRNVQIVLSFHASETEVVRWRFKRMAIGGN